MYKTLLLISFVALALTGSRTPDKSIGVFEGQKILLELYYETECPYCTRFINTQLTDLISVPVTLFLFRTSLILLTSDCILLEMERSLEKAATISFPVSMGRLSAKATLLPHLP